MAFDDNFNVIHKKATTQEEASAFRGSKYVQSLVGEVYKETKEILDTGKEVLFTGTPCQISGLKYFLGKRYDNLLTLDNICHGVPSPKVWRKYLEFRKEEANADISSISFRDKNESWKNYSVSFNFLNSSQYRIKQSEDPYMIAFLRDICLRPSCHECYFKGINRESDITLADYWGVQNTEPDMDDDKGTSLILINSEKGKELFKDINKHLIYKETNLELAIRYNSAAIKSVSKHKDRSSFFEDLDELEFDDLTKKHLSDSIGIRVKKTVRSSLVFILKKMRMDSYLRRILKR